MNRPSETPDNPIRTDALPQDSAAAELAETVRSACIDAALQAYEDARMRGLCHEGAWEAAVGAIRTVDVAELVRAT